MAAVLRGPASPLCLFLAALALVSLPGAGAAVEILGAGASFPADLYADVIFAYQFVQPNTTVSYLATGSSKGKCRIKDFETTCSDSDTAGRPYIDFAGSDSLLKESEYEEYPDLQMLPTVAGSVVPMYNIPVIDTEASEQLIVDREVLSKIFMGRITRWNDPLILAQQATSVAQKLAAADHNITLMVRADGSGTTEVFTKSLNSFSNGEFASTVGSPGSSPNVWAGAVANGAKVDFRDGTSSLSAAVLLTPWSIGYGSAGAAASAGAAVAAFRQSFLQSVPVTAGVNSVGFALLENGLQFGNNGDNPERMTADLMDAKGGLAWPITTYTYAIIRDGIDGDRLRLGATCEHVAAILKFWDWFYTSTLAKQLAERRYFVALPELVVNPVVEKMRSFKCGGDIVYINQEDKALKNLVQGTVDGVTEYIFSFFSLSYQAVDEYASVEHAVAEIPTFSSPMVFPLGQEEGYRIVIGNKIYSEPWVQQELAKVITPTGKPTQTNWDKLHQEGQASSMVLPWFAINLEFYANIPGIPEGASLVVNKETLGLILGGTIDTWRSPRLNELNPWLADLESSDDDMAIKLIAVDSKDSLYEFISADLAPGFPTYELAEKLKSYDQAAIVATGVPGSMIYTSSLSATSSSLAPLSLLWPDAPSAVAPSYDAGLTCAQADAGFDKSTLAFAADASVEGCYPLMLPVNFVFHHSYADNEALCFSNSEDPSSAGEGLASVQFAQWIFETGQATESVLTYSGAIPLTHATLNDERIAAVLHVTDTINCGHPPDAVVQDLAAIIAGSVVGAVFLAAIIGLVYWVSQERNEMKQNPLKGLKVTKELTGVLQDVRPVKDGDVATYIPELSKVHPDLFAIAIVTTGGKVYKVGDWDHEYSIQSMVKPFSYAYALKQRGVEYMKKKVGVEPAGGAFDTIEMDPQGRPFNPYINAGAIAVSMQLRGSKEERYGSFKEFLGSCCGRQLELDHGIYKSESSTAARNREIAEKLMQTGVCKDEYAKEHGLEAYFMQCSTLLNTVDLATMAATCAKGGVNPMSNERVMPQEINEEMMSVMMTCGMYNGAGNWMVDVGIPAKSGVSGGIFGVVPGVCGLAVFSPRLNSTFNSVRGILAFRELSQRMGLHVLQKNKARISYLAPFIGRKALSQAKPSTQPMLLECDSMEPVRKAVDEENPATGDPEETRLIPVATNIGTIRAPQAPAHAWA